MSDVRDFFKNQTVFITGGTGFLGKVLIEKLVRVCDDLERIYVLVRPKKGKSTQERFEDLLEFPCFERLQRDVFRNKISLIGGDCERESLGLTDGDREVLKNNVTCVIHAAANVKFNQSLKVVGGNVRAVRDVLQLAKGMPKLKAFVHVSTAFSNFPESHIKEDFYDPPISPKLLLSLTQEVSNEILEPLTSKLLQKWPNTYTYGKCVAENLVKEEGENLPIAIVRPAIVANCAEEPMPGWVDNFYGVVGIVVAAALGILRSFHAKKRSTAYIVPCDYVSNIVLAAAWDLGNTDRKDDQVPIYNLVGSNKNLITWQDLTEGMEECAVDYPSEKVVWYYCFKLRENKTWHNVCVFLFHMVPAYVVDFFLVCFRRPAIAVAGYKRLDQLLDLLSYFTTNVWSFETDNVDNLHERLTDGDKILFNFNMDEFNWKIAYRTGIVGGRIYLLKDPIETVPKFRRKYRILRVCHYFLVGFLGILFCWVVKLVIGCVE